MKALNVISLSPTTFSFKVFCHCFTHLLAGTPVLYKPAYVQIMYIKYDVTTQPQKPTKSFLLSAVTRSDSLQQIVLVATLVVPYYSLLY